jgi:two-component system phosphate regulon sensor histidine kinase PhoR
VLYWLLLLGPALTVGGGALWLLQRERDRVLVQSNAADAARWESVAERTRLIAENIEVLVSDVQTTLGQTLGEATDDRAQIFLEGLRRTNPLVADAFEADPRGVVIWGGVNVETAEWVQLRSWDPQPVVAPAVAVQPEERLRQVAEKKESDSMRKQVASNVGNYLSARSSVQEVASLKMEQEEEPKRVFPNSIAASADRSDEKDDSVGRRREQATNSAVTWSPWQEGGALHVFGWLRTSEGSVRGVSLDLDVLHRQLMAVLPVERAADERYELLTKDAPLSKGGVSLYSRDREGASEGARVPLAATMLPGWKVEGRWLGREETGLGGGVFFTLTGALVAPFVVAIIVGGGLLLREARRSELEAQQKTSFVANISHELKTP